MAIKIIHLLASAYKTRVIVPIHGCMHTRISTSNNGNMLHLTMLTAQMSKISLSLLLTPILTEVVPICGDFPMSSQLAQSYCVHVHIYVAAWRKHAPLWVHLRTSVLYIRNSLGGQDSVLTSAAVMGYTSLHYQWLLLHSETSTLLVTQKSLTQWLLLLHSETTSKSLERNLRVVLWLNIKGHLCFL